MGDGNRRFAEHPGKRYLSAGNATLLCDLAQAVDDFAVGFFGLRVQAFPELVGFVALGAFGFARGGPGGRARGDSRE